MTVIVDPPGRPRLRFPTEEAFACWLRHSSHSAGTLRVVNLATSTLRAVVCEETPGVSVPAAPASPQTSPDGAA